MSHRSSRASTSASNPCPNRVRFRIVGDICPNLLPRILGLLVQFETIPWSMALTRTPATLSLSIDLDRPEGLRADILLNKIGAIPSVRRATLVKLRP